MAPLQDGDNEVVERFHATSGRITGWLSVVVAALVAVAGVVYLDDGFPAWVAAAALLAGVLAWAAMLRPALWVTREHLVMQNMLETVHVRLAAVEEMAVRQVLVVRAGDRRLVSTVVGRTWRKALLARRGPGSDRTREDMPYPDFVENRVYELVDAARTSAGVKAGSKEQLALPDAVRREPAMLTVSLVVASVLVLLVSFFV
ncbi:hypothetical protein EUA93_01550 [Nocardioides oleivorans]|uniref:Uncharacterized protein n=1 Tax=Nocardioides oleivorans TaxID=273676 RepID=A0A4V1RKR0_9ACTN|nr:hypothetical protein [Nocardioides oleivorans]RYB93152.1 hypothetical protein EUA93_01550 [Nocardioides oleivorans]